MKILPRNKYKVVLKDIISFLNSLKDNNIKITNLNKIEDNIYTFFSSIKYKKTILSLYNVEIISCNGLFYHIFSFLKYKTTIIALILSTISYLSLSNRIWIININGDNDSLNSLIEEKLIDNNIYIGAKKKNVDELSYIQKELLYKNFNVIEYLSIESNGCCINVNFKKKRNENEPIKYKKSLFAKKDGVIKSFDVLSGEKVVKVNDFVRQGDLLVKDIITTDYNQDVYIGTYGNVYAYTWYYVTIKENISNVSKETLFANLLINAKREISINFTSNEYISEENVLKFNIVNNIVEMKIHFTCVENIARE